MFLARPFPATPPAKLVQESGSDTLVVPLDGSFIAGRNSTANWFRSLILAYDGPMNFNYVGIGIGVIPSPVEAQRNIFYHHRLIRYKGFVLD